PDRPRFRARVPEMRSDPRADHAHHRLPDRRQGGGSRADVPERHFHHAGTAGRPARAVDPLRLRFPRASGRAAAHGSAFFRAHAPRRSASLPAGNRLASARAEGEPAVTHSDWEIVVGLETHAQLATRSKMFSGAATAFGAAPNTQASAVDIALPGVLPVANRAAVAHAIRFGIAVGGTIRRRSIFARKN